MKTSELDSDRRRLLRALAGIPFLLAADPALRWVSGLAAAERIRAKGSGSGHLAPTPDCGDGDEPTPSETEGPFFKPDSPRRTSLIEPGFEGTRIVLTGRAFSKSCRPISGALLDFWHADRDGEYDNVGFKLRGHQFADADGRFRLETIVPGQYDGRTRHIHVKVQPPGGRILTTQLYFPGEPRNKGDFLFRPDLLVVLRNASTAKQAKFNFILDVS